MTKDKGQRTKDKGQAIVIYRLETYQRSWVKSFPLKGEKTYSLFNRLDSSKG